MSQPAEQFSVPSAPPATGRRSWLRRWGFPLGVALFWCAVVGFAQLSGSLDGATRFLVTASCTLLCTLLGICWAIFQLPISSAARYGVLTLLFAGLAACAFSIRLDGVDGDIMPRVAWAWTPKHDQLLGKPEIIETAASQTPNLLSPGEHDFPQFLGPDRNAILSGPKLARDWTAQPPRELWRMEIGAGWSSFAVVGDYAVTQEQRGEEELVVCYQLATGQPTWSHADKVRHETSLGGIGPRATPTIHEGRVYTVGATGIFNCLDGSTGNLIWQKQLNHPGAVVPQWGKSCSPLIVDDLVVVSAGDGPGKSLIAFDQQSGDQVWAAGDQPASYSSPMLTTLSSQEQIVIVNQESVAGHDPKTGQIFWEYPWPGVSPKVPQPIPVAGDRLLISAGYGLGCQLLSITAGNQGPRVDDDPLAYSTMKPKFTNPVVVGKYLYGLDDGVLACVEWETGKRQWRRGRYGHGQLLLVDDLLLVQAESGEILLVEASPEEFKELTRYPALANITWNVPTLTGNTLLVRNDREAACLELPLAE